MASTQATAQSYNDTNVIGQVLQIGAARNTGQFMAAIGGLKGARRIKSQAFDMCASYSLDTPAQDAIDETASLSAASERFYAKTLVPNVVQITKKQIIVSDLREAATDQIVASTFVSPNLPQVSEFDAQAAKVMQQFNADWEFSCLQGIYVARSVVTTDVAAGGLVDSTVGITTNRVNASSAALEAAMISELMVTMAEHGAPFDNLAIVARPTFIDQLGLLYGFMPQDRNVGGIMLKQIWTTFGPLSLIWSMAAHATTLVIADMAHIRPVVLPHKGGIDVLMKEYQDGGSAQRGYIEGFIGVDFEHESLHGSVYGLSA
jgi:hypothetical protein